MAQTAQRPAKRPGVALVSPDDTDKLYGIADPGIHAFELTPEYFNLVPEQIAAFDPTRNPRLTSD